MVENCLRKVLNEGLLNEAYPIDEELEDKLWRISLYLEEVLEKVKVEKSYSPLVASKVPEGWSKTPYDEENDIIGSKMFEFEEFPPIVLKIPEFNLARGAYEDNLNEIWLFVEPKERAEDIFDVLYHETIHYLDIMRHKMPHNHGHDMDELPDSLPYCFKTIFYKLWNKFELRAHAYQYANIYGEEYAYSMYHSLIRNYTDCMKYKDNSKVWKQIEGIVWGDRKNRRNTKNKFKSRTEHLLLKFKDLIDRQFRAEQEYRLNNGEDPYRYDKENEYDRPSKTTTTTSLDPYSDRDAAYDAAYGGYGYGGNEYNFDDMPF